jgi:predicted metal-binding membrane protein
MIASGAGSSRGFLELLAGYLVIWLGFSAVAGAGQLVLFRAGLLSPLGQSVSPWLTGGLLITAGIYQFSPLKESCLSKCRQPMAFFMQYWRETRFNDVALGLRLGAICLGCCWALMLLGFVGGVMNLAFMGLATFIMIFEKLPDLGRYVTRPLGWVLIGGGVLAIIQGG